MIALVIASLAVAGVLTLVIRVPSSPCADTSGTVRHFTIIADLNGFNGSKYQTGFWPTVTVQQCDTVVIKVVNDDTQIHGFAIDYYATRGLGIPGQQSQSLTFLASRTGQFRMFCDVFCTGSHIHAEWSSERRIGQPGKIATTMTQLWPFKGPAR